MTNIKECATKNSLRTTALFKKSKSSTFFAIYFCLVVYIYKDSNLQTSTAVSAKLHISQGTSSHPDPHLQLLVFTNNGMIYIQFLLLELTCEAIVNFFVTKYEYFIFVKSLRFGFLALQLYC